MVLPKKDQIAIDRLKPSTDTMSLSAAPPDEPKKPFSYSRTLGRIALYSLAAFTVAVGVHLFTTGTTPIADHAMWFFGSILLGSVIILLLIAEDQGNERKMARADKTAAFLKRNNTADIYITAGYGRIIGVDWTAKTIFLGDDIDKVEILPFADILEVSVEVDGVTETISSSNTKTSRGSQVGSAVAAGLLLGPAGFIVGGLSAGSKTKGKSIATTLIKSITLIVRIRSKSSPVRRIDLLPFTMGKRLTTNHGIIIEASKKAAHYRALLTQIIEDRASPAIAQADASSATPMADQIDRLWTLHEKGALTRAEFDGHKAKLLSAVSVAKLAIVGLMACSSILALPRPASAYDLGHILRGTPEGQLQSTKSIGAVEKCIVLLDLPGPPVVYHYLDAPGTLVHGGREAYPLFVFELVPAVDHLDVVIWQGTGQRPKLEKCL